MVICFLIKPYKELFSLSIQELQESDFGQANYFANNFNDCLSGLVVLFELMIVNNWYAY
jgi:hypothetical protein